MSDLRWWSFTLSGIGRNVKIISIMYPSNNWRIGIQIRLWYGRRGFVFFEYWSKKDNIFLNYWTLIRV